MTSRLDQHEHWIEFERRHAWHPYTSVPAMFPSLPVESANGVRIRLTDGTELVDGMSSWWAAIHGYNHPVLNRALCEQAEKMSHVMFGGLTHRPAAELVRRLVNLTPPGLDRVFLCDSGSVSVEVAMKMACQYWMSKDRPEKTRFISLRRGYHGDTIGAMSVSDPENGMHELFRGLLAQQIYIPAPPQLDEGLFHQNQLETARSIIENHARESAALILEPMVQGAGGMRFYHADFLAGLRRLCDENDILLIADEIATGFGRTGTLFGCEHAAISPDIMCLGKALTGGFMTLAATLCTDRVAIGICESGPGVFMHGPTFMANPLACAVANASIDLLLESDWHDRVSAIQAQLENDLQKARKLSGVADVRVFGAIGVIEMKQSVDMGPATEKLLETGVWLRPFGRLIYTMPPFIMEEGDLGRVTSAMCSLAGL